MLVLYMGTAQIASAAPSLSNGKLGKKCSKLSNFQAMPIWKQHISKRGSPNNIINFIIQNQNAPEEAEKAEADESWLKDWEEEQALRKGRIQKVPQQTVRKFRTSIVVTAN